MSGNVDVQADEEPKDKKKSKVMSVKVEVLCVLDSRMSVTKKKTKLNSMALARERTIPTERPLPVGEVSANFCG